MTRVALYLRVSTDTQSVEMQRHELLATAARRGWDVVAEFADEGISGAKGRDRRPGFDRLIKLITRRKVDMVAAWSIDRLSRSLTGLLSFLEELQARHIDLYLEKQAVDTSTAAGKAMFQMLGVFAEFERAMTQERIVSGIAKAREHGTKSGKAFGHPKVISSEREQEARQLLRDGLSVRGVARQLGLGNGTVGRIRQAMTRDQRWIDRGIVPGSTTVPMGTARAHHTTAGAA